MESGNRGHAPLMPPDEDLVGHWARMERLLRQVLSQVSVSPAARRCIEDYLDHNELGLAYETLIETAARPIPSRPLTLLTDVADAMDLDAPRL